MRNKTLLTFWQWLLLLALLLGAVWATETLVTHEQQHQRSQQLRHEIASAGQLRALLESELNIPLYLTIGLAAHIQANNGDISPTEMQLLLPELAHQARHIRNIGIAPGNTLRYVYPLSGNEKAIGIYYPDLTEQWPDIAAIIERREARLVGPITLVQGGSAFIYRLPVYLNANDYWGIVSTVVDIGSVWALLERQTTEQEVQVAIRSLNSAGTPSPAFYGNNSLFYDDSLLLGISLRGALWQMALRSVANVPDRSGQIRLLSYSISALLLGLLLWLFMSRQHLRHSVLAQQRSKRYLQSIMDNVNDAIITTTPDGVIEQVNLSCLPMFSYTAGALIGQHWSILLAEPDKLDELYSATSNAKVECETQGRRRDNSFFPIAVNRSHIQLQNQSRQLLVLRDLTERQQTEQLKQQFISTVSHELRTPLTSVSAALGLAVSGALGDLTESQQRMLKLAHTNCQQLSSLINDLLDVEKLASGTITLDLTAVTLPPLLTDCINDMQLLQPGILLQLDCPADLAQVVVNADASHLQQVVRHVLGNAVKFSPKGGTVQVAVSLVADNVRVTVTDQGKGVAEEFVPRLFSRFSQADSSDQRLHSGTGLGLAISRSLIQQMHGTMGYYPAALHGSCFYFELPYQPALQPKRLP
ncbi:MAG: PAS domain S-box protein [Chromatiaceae bacterium]|nr:PAS domain S-box protein [Chromatiaceae bacterium]